MSYGNKKVFGQKKTKKQTEKQNKTKQNKIIQLQQQNQNQNKKPCIRKQKELQISCCATHLK